MWGIVALGLAGFAALVLWRASVHEAHAEAHFPPEGRIIKVGDADVHVVEMGQGPDLVLIHGASGNTRDMTFSLAGKLATDYRVVVFDRPGLGYTPQINPAGDSLQSQATLLQAPPPRSAQSAQSSWAKVMAAQSRWPGPFITPIKLLLLYWFPPHRTSGPALSRHL